MGRTYHSESMSKIQHLYKTVFYQRKSDIIGLGRSYTYIRSIVVLVYWPKSASVQSNQTIKAIY
jgi:hypothetical protein